MNDCIYSCPNDTSKPELSLQVRTRNLECLGSNWHALRAWVWGLIAPKLARKTCQLTSRIDPRRKQTRLATVKVLKYKLPQEFNMIPNVQLMTKRPAENTPRKSCISYGKIVMDKTDIGWNCLLNWPPVTYSFEADSEWRIYATTTWEYVSVTFELK